MVVEGLQAVPVLVDSISHWNDALGGLNSQLSFDWLVLAQDVSNTPDILSNISDAWNNFVKTGQIWALLIGIVIGYLFRGMTSF
ncbi:MAG: hypothetical protein M3O33_13390 [Cyanobacteriota bacterium]|nr:hypothetical protein [Cyanobacteriota bacterium]